MRFWKQVNSLTCEIFSLFPLEPALTIDLKLLNSDKLFWALAPVLSRHSFKIRLTLFSNVWRREFPGVGSSWLLWACSMTSLTSFFDFLIVFWISWYVSLSAIQSSIPVKQMFSYEYQILKHSEISRKVLFLNISERIKNG